MMTYLCNILENIGNYLYDTIYLEYLEQYRKMHFSWWLICILTLVFLFFLMLPYCFLYPSALLIRAYCYCYRLRSSNDIDMLDGARNTVSKFWAVLGWLWHGYEMIGLENIPETVEGGALLIYYHGAVPVDFLYIVSRIYLIKRRCIRGVIDNFFFSKMHGLKPLVDLFHAFNGSFQDCVKNLKEGHLVAIAPGGVKEAMFGDEEYQIIWSKRIGFAKVALEAQVPIIPVFTQNVSEAFRTVKIGRKYLRKVYEKSRLPVVPVYGGFPVKLRTYLGKPIPYDPNMTAEELAAKTAQAVENLISLHQRVPGNILKGIIDRVHEKPKQKTL